MSSCRFASAARSSAKPGLADQVGQNPEMAGYRKYRRHGD
jgi:hypothetical protein